LSGDIADSEAIERPLKVFKDNKPKARQFRARTGDVAEIIRDADGGRRTVHLLKKPVAEEQPDVVELSEARRIGGVDVAANRIDAAVVELVDPKLQGCAPRGHLQRVRI